VQPLQQRQRESGGLAGAGLRGADQVAAGKDYGNGLRLDRGGLGVALLGDRARERVQQTERRERRFDENLLSRSAWEGVAFRSGSGRSSRARSRSGFRSLKAG
jgi:hypothetical protein